MSNLLKSFLLTGLVVLFLFSCEEPTEVGGEIIPPGDALEVDTIENLSVVLNVIEDDVIFTDNFSNILLGAKQSNVFGNSYASLYSEVGIISAFDTEEDYTYDSLILYLRPSSFLGDSTIAQSFNVYQLADSIATGEEFVADTEFPIGTLIGTIDNVKPSTANTVINGDTLDFHISTRLDDGLGQMLLQKLDDGEIDSDSSLQAFFKGIYIEPVINSSAQGTFAINLDRVLTGGDDRSGISIYYKTPNDTSTYDLTLDPLEGVTATIDGEVRYFPGVQNHNRIWTDYSTAEADLQTQIATYSPGGYEVGYTQAGNGLVTLIELPNAASTLDGFQINKAELVLEGIVDPTSLIDTLFLPTFLVLNERFGEDEGELNGLLVDIAGNGDLLDPDRVYDATAVAFLNLDEVNGETVYRYTFNLPSYVQNIISGEVQDSLLLSTSARINSFSGLKFGNLNHPTNSAKFKVIYTKPN